MPTSCAPPPPAVYQLGLVLRGVRPLIWRRGLLGGDTTIAALQATVQLVLGWSDEHRHSFVIQGRAYGVAHLGGLRRVL